MTRVKYCDKEDKFCFLKRAVAGTECGLNGQQRIPAAPSFERLMNVLYLLLRKLGTYNAQAKAENTEASEVFRKSFGKKDKERKELKRPSQ